MIISRRRYERELQEAQDRGYKKAEEHFYERSSMERIWEEIRRLQDKVRRLEPNQGSADNERCASINPF